MTYDPNVDHTVERTLGNIKGQIFEKHRAIDTLKAEIDMLQTVASNIETIQRDEQRRLESLKKE